MVLPIQRRGHEMGRSAEWRLSLICVSLLSCVVGALCWLGTGDPVVALWGFAAIWFMAIGFVLVSVTWGIMIIPWMILVARLTKGGNRK
jgi:hypothetical protein